MELEELIINIDYYLVKLANEDNKNVSNIQQELILIKTFLLMNESDKKEIEKATDVYYNEKDLINRGKYIIEQLENIN